MQSMVVVVLVVIVVVVEPEVSYGRYSAEGVLFTSHYYGLSFCLICVFFYFYVFFRCFIEGGLVVLWEGWRYIGQVETLFVRSFDHISYMIFIYLYIFVCVAYWLLMFVLAEDSA